MSYSVQPPLLALKDFFGSDSNDRLVVVLGALDLEPLLQRLDRRRDRGRRGYSQRAMLQAVIASHVYGLHSMAELRRELLRNGSLRILCGIHSVGQVPSEDALSRFYARLAEMEKEAAVENLHRGLIEQVRELAPEVGKKVAVVPPRSAPGPTATALCRPTRTPPGASGATRPRATASGGSATRRTWRWMPRPNSHWPM